MRQRENIRSLLAVRTNRRSLIRTFLSGLWFLFIMLRSLLDDKSIRGTGQRQNLLKENCFKTVVRLDLSTNFAKFSCFEISKRPLKNVENFRDCAV